MLQSAVLCVLGIILFPDRVLGFGHGAPGSTCLALYPKHGVPPQATPSPFSISVTPSNYTPSQQLTVVIEAGDGRGFAGLALVVQRPTGAFDDEEVLGSFDVSANQSKLQAIDCLGGTRNFVTHINSAPVSRLQFSWTAPATNTGPVVFRATIVQTKEVFWLGVEKPVSPVNSSSVASPSYENPPVSGTLSSVDLTSCGTAKSCVLHPSGCGANPSTCHHALTFAKSGNNVTFEMFAQAEAYVSLGLSNDTSMGDDQTVTCVADGSGRTSVQHGYNPEKYNFWQYRRGLRGLATKKENGKVYCRFTMPPNMRVFTSDGTKTFPFSQPYYLMLAWGGVHQGTVVIQHHSAIPLVTSTPVSLEGPARLYQWGAATSSGDGHGHSHDVNDNSGGGNGNGHDVTRPACGVIVSALALVLYAMA